METESGREEFETEIFDSDKGKEGIDSDLRLLRYARVADLDS